MPFYEYRCERGHTFEVMQRMSDEPLASCTTCHAAVQRVFHPVAVHFKGSGFYNTDYGKGRGRSSDESTSNGSESKSSDTGSQGQSSGAGSDSASTSSQAEGSSTGSNNSD